MYSISFDFAEAINIIISTLIGIGLSYFTAWSYESFQNSRKKEKDRKTYQHLESKDDNYDWQHHDVRDGKIQAPQESFTKLKYKGGNEIKFEWIEPGKTEISGTGTIIFSDSSLGVLHFFSFPTINYKYRNLLYRQIEYNNQLYDGLFVDATDEGNQYVLMRKKYQ